MAGSFVATLAASAWAEERAASVASFPLVDDRTEPLPVEIVVTGSVGAFPDLEPKRRLGNGALALLESNPYRLALLERLRVDNLRALALLESNPYQSALNERLRAVELRAHDPRLASPYSDQLRLLVAEDSNATLLDNPYTKALRDSGSD